jgi:hypothetical protein
MGATRANARAIASLSALLVVAGSLGCAFGEWRPHDPMQREYSLEEMQKRYTDLVRFSNFDMASKFLPVQERRAFIASMPNEDELRFLDYETEPIILNERMTESTIEVSYTAYSPWNLTQLELYETQVWTRPEGIGNGWQVQSTFVGLERFVKKRRRPSAKPAPVSAP